MTFINTGRFKISLSGVCADRPDTSRSNDLLSSVNTLTTADSCIHRANTAHPISPILLLHCACLDAHAIYELNIKLWLILAGIAGILLGAMASLTRDHRGRRPEHVNTGMTRELGRASSLPVRENADQCGVIPRGSLPRYQSSPPERPVAPPGRSLECNRKRRRRVRRDELDSEGTPDER